jgi:hypothetical protein
LLFIIFEPPTGDNQLEKKMFDFVVAMTRRTETRTAWRKGNKEGEKGKTK